MEPVRIGEGECRGGGCCIDRAAVHISVVKYLEGESRAVKMATADQEKS